MKSSGSNVKRRNKTGGITLAELPVLQALLTVPSTFFLPDIDGLIEPPKAALLWVASALAVTLAVWSEGARLRALVAGRPVIRLFLVACLCGAGALALSVWVSDAPALNWWGSGLRRFGGATEVSLLAMMMATSLLTSDPRRLHRALAVAAIGSFVPTIVALAQWTGFDPFDALGPRWARPGSTFGNPLFFAGYLVTTLPLTVACAVRSPRPWTRSAWWVLVALQAIALVAARSVGPVLALVAATTIGAAALLASRRRILSVAIASVMAVAAVAALLAGPRLIHASQATVRFRVLLWQAAGVAIGAEPGRSILGSGPESTIRSLIRHADPSVRNIEGQTVVPDRAHNQTLDAIAAFGAVGFGIRMAIEYLALAAAFTVFGLLPASALGRFAMLAFAVNVCAVGTAWMFAGLWTLAMAVPMAFVLVASIWIVWTASRFEAAPRHDVAVLAAGATVGWLAHYLEVQTGIATVSSALVGAMALGATVGAAGPANRAADRPRTWLGLSIAAATAAMVAAAVWYVSLAGLTATNDLALSRDAAILATQAEAAVGGQRNELMRAAVQRLERAWIVNPYNYRSARNLASLERRWAKTLPPAERAPHLKEADRWYAAALDLAPSLPFLWEEWANLALERGLPTEGLQRLERMLELGPPPGELFDLGDAALSATGVDVTRPDGISRAVDTLKGKGLPRLAERYAARRR